MVAFVLLISDFSYFIIFENKAYDNIIRLKNKSIEDEKIVIVVIDDESFQSLNVQWPFPREYYIKLIENLNIAGAKQIIFDIEFSETYNQEIDSALGEIASKYDNVIFAGKIYQTRDHNFSRLTILPPVNDITSFHAVWGLVNMTSDLDGFVRRYPLFLKHGDSFLYSLALKSIFLHSDYSLKIDEANRELVLYTQNDSAKVVYGFQNDIKLDYYGPQKTFRHIPLSSVIDDSSFVLPMEEYFQINDFYHLLDNNVFKDKIVLIGASADELKDNFLTPVNLLGELMPGVEIHANMLQNFLDLNFITVIPKIYKITYLLFISLLSSLLFKKFSPQITFFIALFMFSLYLFISFFLFAYRNFIIPLLPGIAIIIILYIYWLVKKFMIENKEKKIIKKTFQHYMAPALVKELLKSPENLKYGGALKEITVLFSDIRSFTTYTESHDVQDTVSMLREYLSEMVHVIIKNQGILDKFVGDEVMALFNTPVEIENHPLKACICALEMIERLRYLQKKWQDEGKETINIGIGVNTGFAVVGNLGSEQIFDYTAIGDTVNLGARLEALNKNYQTQNNIIISEFTLEFVKDYVVYEYLDDVIVKGKTVPIKIYQLIRLKTK